MTLVPTGVLSGILTFAGVDMLVRPDLPGDTPSFALAALLMAGALVVTIAGVGVATAMPWSRGLARVVGVACSILGFGGLLYLVVVTLMVAGSFPDTLLEPLNLSTALLMVVSGLAGAGLLMDGAAPPSTGGTAGPWPARSWHPVAAGIAIGIAAAWLWSAFIWPLIPYQCCRA